MNSSILDDSLSFLQETRVASTKQHPIKDMRVFIMKFFLLGINLFKSGNEIILWEREQV